MKFARWVFALAGIYGFLLMAPLYFMEGRIGADNPPAITHPEYFYGFIGVTLAWQIVFLLIASNPVRYRPIMLAAVLEKVSFGGAALVLHLLHRVPASTVCFGAADLFWLVLFVVAYLLCCRQAQA